MTQTKLEIIGPYTPDHEGPFCTRDEMPVDLRIRDGRGEYCLIGYVGERTAATTWGRDGEYIVGRCPLSKDLMNAREVPVAREFWVNEYRNGVFSEAHTSADDAMGASIGMGDFLRTIHVREVLPGEE